MSHSAQANKKHIAPSKDLPPLERLVRVMASLRDPNGGCPWDLEQDFKSISAYTIEEAYEVADAIDHNDMPALREELGDLILQPIYHAQMAAEKGLFNINDVITDVVEKMIARHPHVFGDTDAQSASDVNKIWEERKTAEKKGNQSVLDNVTKGLPALLRATKLQKKAAKTGFEWPEISDVLDKFEEELQEMRAALHNKDKANQTEELGDMLFVLANLARMLDINPETALRDCNNKFERRFRGLEQALNAKEGGINNASLQDMEKEWDKQKLKERSA